MAAIVLCTLFLVALSGIGIVTAQEDDYVLDIYGNANEDDTIDMRDLTYVKLIFFGKKPETELADAKYDGKINPLDFVQIKLIIVGKEKQLTLLDDADRIVTVNKPMETIVSGDTSVCAMIRALKAKDRLIGIPKSVAKMTTLFPEMGKLQIIGSHYTLDYEMVYKLDPDIFIIYAPSAKYSGDFEDMVDKLEPQTKVLGLSFMMPGTMVENVRKLGYILDKREEAEEFIAWYEGHMDTIEERVSDIPEEDKPRVIYELYPGYDYKVITKPQSRHEHMVIAGGINIAADLSAGSWGPGYADVDPEWVIVENPDIILKTTTSTRTSSGYDVDDQAEMRALRDSIMNRPELANVEAVKNGQVYVFTTDITATIYFVCIGYFAKWFHPELFSDFDPQAVHQEYIDRFCPGVDYDLSEHGVFVYPEP